MDGSPRSKKNTEQNYPFAHSPTHRHNIENMDYVGITITEDFAQQKDISTIPSVSSQRLHHQPQQNQIQSQRHYLPSAVQVPNVSQGQDPPLISIRRRSENYIHHPIQTNYSGSSTTATSTHILSHQHRPPQSSQQLPQLHQHIPQLYSSSSQKLSLPQYLSHAHHHSQTHQPPLLNPTAQLQIHPQQRSISQSHPINYQSKIHQNNTHQSALPIKSYHMTHSSPPPSVPPRSLSTSSSFPSSGKNTLTSNFHLRNDFDKKHSFRGSLFRHIRSKSDMHPPPSRRNDPGKQYLSPLKALTVKLSSTYHRVNPNFRYEHAYNPRRVLTKPSKGVKNDGYDNEDSDYILYVNDILGSEEGQKYLILDILGQGTFGQVVKCLNFKTKEIVAVKVVKNKPAYFNQSMMEVAILELLNQKWDNHDEHHILRLRDTFIHKKHLCLVFELLSVNLYELIKQNQFRGLSTNLVRVFTAQLLDALTILNEARIIHCDLKPENVLLKNLESPTIKVIDFGSACHARQTVYTYIQSRFYRSPEVLLGLPYSSSIDMWSVGCIAVELFLGLPLFPGSSEYNQVSRIVEMLGIPPTYMIEVGKTASEYFERYTDEQDQKKYRLKSMEQYMQEHNCVEQPSKKYFSAIKLSDIIKNYPITRKGSTQKDIDKEMQNRLAFIDFVQGLLNLNPIERWSPQQAKLHPFITGEKFIGKFTPPMQLKSAKSNLANAQTVPQLIGAANQTSTMHLSPMSSQSAQSSPTASPKIPQRKVVTINTESIIKQNQSNSIPKVSPRHSSVQTSNKSSSLMPKSSIGSLNRPRASTIGNVQVPPQIQRAAALVSPGRAPREKDPRRLPLHYPHLNFLQEHEPNDTSPFSVVVDGDNRRQNESKNPNINEVYGIRISENWSEMNEVRQRDEPYSRDDQSPREERYHTGASNDVSVKRTGEGHGTSMSSNEKRLRGDSGMQMPGTLPNGVLDDNDVGTSVLPLHVSPAPLRNYRNSPNNHTPNSSPYPHHPQGHPLPIPPNFNYPKNLPLTLPSRRHENNYSTSPSSFEPSSPEYNLSPQFPPQLPPIPQFVLGNSSMENKNSTHSDREPRYSTNGVGNV
ncbi:hypothetical protein G9A89_005731 [Geosiphon pyriformis]|nr:hypothetical protein G9A89_005731 [Geosiphon pyriformis]